MSPPSASPEHFDGPGDKINLRNEFVGYFFLVFEERGGGGSNRLFPIQDVGKRVDVDVIGPTGPNTVDEAGSMSNPLGGIEGPMLGGSGADKEHTHRNVVREDVGGEGPGWVGGKLKSPEFFQGVST